MATKTNPQRNLKFTSYQWLLTTLRCDRLTLESVSLVRNEARWDTIGARRNVARLQCDMERSVFAADAGPGLLVVTTTTTTVSTHSFVFVTIDVVLTLVAAVPTFILTNLLALSITRLNGLLTFSSRSPPDSLSRFFQRQICNKKNLPWWSAACMLCLYDYRHRAGFKSQVGQITYVRVKLLVRMLLTLISRTDKRVRQCSLWPLVAFKNRGA